jgi:hypothetical protein
MCDAKQFPAVEGVDACTSEIAKISTRDVRSNRDPLMQTKVILTLDRELLLALYRLAATQNLTLSELIAKELRAVVQSRRSFERARTRALGRLREGLELHWVLARSRNDLHSR